MWITILCLSAAIFLMYREYLAQNKRKKIQRIRRQVHKPMKSSNLKDAVIMGTATVGLSLFDIYSTMEKHAQVLDVLEQRFPKVNGANDIWDWFTKINTMLENNADSLETYVSCFKGQAAENIAVQLLKERGLDAELFDSLTNETNDIYVHLQNNSMKYYSVKCGDTSYVKQCIEESGATNFIINSESYQELDGRGLIDVYERKGIEVIDGNYSNTELTYMAENAFEEIGDAGDVSDSIPYVALAFLGIKTYKNFKDYSEGRQSKHELIANIEMDVLKIGTAGIVAGITSEIGAGIGTMILPGVGTVIGAGIGVIGGALMSSSLIEWGKEKLKWGKIIAAQDYFGEKFKNKFEYSFSNNVVDKYMDTAELYKVMKEEKAICNAYEAELNPYNKKDVSVSAILAQEYYNSLELIKKRISYTKIALGRETLKICQTSVSALEEKKREKFSKRLLGELILGNIDHLPSLTAEEQNLVAGYCEQKRIASNYPYQFSCSPQLVMENLVKQIFNSYQPIEKNSNRETILHYICIIVLVVIGFIFLI